MIGLLLAVVVVDQIDAPGALVELAAGELLEVDARCLPAGAGEGDRVLALVWAVRGDARCPVRGLRVLTELRGPRAGA